MIGSGATPPIGLARHCDSRLNFGEEKRNVRELGVGLKELKQDVLPAGSQREQMGGQAIAQKVAGLQLVGVKAPAR